jgi:hypothetical protein
MSYASRVYLQRNAHVYDQENNKQDSPVNNRSREHFHGNRGSGAFFQPKLSIGQPNDAYEQEAETMARAVVNHQAGAAPVVQQRNISSVQRLATPIEEEKLSTNEDRMRKDKEIQEKPQLQRMCPACEKEKEKKGGAVQRKSDGGGTASPALSSRIESSAGKGRALPKKTLSDMQSSFGVDFSHVHIHADSEAISMNQELGAQAFTHGNDIYFNSGMYDPSSGNGRHLLAHELTHVVQQRDGTVQRQPEPNFFEQFAETAGNLLNNGCRKTTSVECPGTSSNYQRLGYVEPMLLVNTGSCTLYVHGIDANGSSLNDSFVEIPPGEQRFFIPSYAAVDTAVVCQKDCSGRGVLDHPYYCV